MTFRVLGPHEQGRFAPEAWGHLLTLSNSGALTPQQLESIIERALSQIDGRIALEELRLVIAGAANIEGGLSGDGSTVH